MSATRRKVFRPLSGQPYHYFSANNQDLVLNQVDDTQPDTVISGDCTAIHSWLSQTERTVYGLVKFVEPELFLGYAQFTFDMFLSATWAQNDEEFTTLGTEAVTAKVYLMLEGWNPETVTWNTKPALPTISISATSSCDEVVFPMTLGAVFSCGFYPDLNPGEIVQGFLFSVAGSPVPLGDNTQEIYWLPDVGFQASMLARE